MAVTVRYEPSELVMVAAMGLLSKRIDIILFGRFVPLVARVPVASTGSPTKAFVVFRLRVISVGLRFLLSIPVFSLFMFFKRSR